MAKIQVKGKYTETQRKKKKNSCQTAEYIDDFLS